MIKTQFKSPIPNPGESIRGESGRIGYLLRQANLAHQILIEKVLSPFKLTLPQFSVLTFLMLYPGVSNADLARLTLLTPQTVLVIVKNLERMQLIRRQAHPVHGRIQEIYLTSKGQSLTKKCQKPVEALQQELTQGLPVKDEQVIRRWLVKLATKIN